MKFACVFPGQGSQSVGMLSDVINEGIVAETFKQASEVLGYDLAGLVSDGPETDLNQTDRTQPALLTAGVALWRLWQQRTEHRPAMLAGHSLGEYTALVCGGSLDFEAAVALVRLRGEAMQAAVPAGHGAMAAILGLDDQAAQAVCDEASGSGIVAAVNFNAPGQVVIAGESNAVEEASEKAKAAGAKKVIPLSVSVPSHCALMAPAAEKLSAALAEIELRSPEIPVVNNVEVAVQSDPEAIKKALVRQVCEPVLWVATINAMKDQGVEHIVELGPGKVLAGLNRRIDRRMGVAAVLDGAALEAAIQTMENGE